MAKAKTVAKKKSAPKKPSKLKGKKQDRTHLVPKKVQIKTGKYAGTYRTVYVKPSQVEDKREEKEEKEEEETRKTKKTKQRGESLKTRKLEDFDLDSDKPLISPHKMPKDLMSPYYMQVPFRDENGERKWKLYPNAGAYHKDFPNGPEKGHLLVNQAHPDHLMVKRNATFAIVGKQKFKTAAQFLSKYPVPSPQELKRMYAGKEPFKGFSGDLQPDFSHIEWHPGSKVFNAHQKMWLGVHDAYRKHREPLLEKYDRERYARAGMPWSQSDYQARMEIVKHQEHGAKKRKERLFGDPTRNNPIKNIAELERIKDAGNIKKGTSVKFLLGGKVVVGKVVNAAAFNAQGQPLKNKAATHFKIQYQTGEKGGNKEITLTKDKIEKAEKKKVRKTKSEVSEQKEIRRKESEHRTLEEAKKRLGVKSDPEFQKKVLELMSGEHGLQSYANPINKFLSRKVEKIVGDWGANGSLQTMRGPDGRLYVQDLSHGDLMDAARVGVFEAIMDYDPKKGSLIQFIGSDKTEHFIKNALKESLAIERGRIDTLSQEGRTMIANLKWAEEAFRVAHEGRRPTNAELIDAYKHQFPQEHETNQKKQKYNYDKMIDRMRRSKVSNVIRSSQPGDEGGEVDLLDQVHSPFKTPEDVAMEKVQMSDMRTNLHNALRDSYAKTGHKNPEAAARIAAKAMMLRHRVDESTTGMGVFGEESPYYDTTKEQARKYEQQYKGKTTGKDPHTRNVKEVASLVGISPQKTEALIDDAMQRIRDQYKTGNEHATKLFNQFFRKSFQQKLSEMKGYMLKSLFPEKRDVAAEHQLLKAFRMVRAVFFQAA